MSHCLASRPLSFLLLLFGVVVTFPSRAGGFAVPSSTFRALRPSPPQQYGHRLIRRDSVGRRPPVRLQRRRQIEGTNFASPTARATAAIDVAASASVSGGPSFRLPFVSPSDAWGNVAILAASASLAQILGTTTSIGRLLGPPVTAMAIAFVFGSIGVLPPGGSAGASTLQTLCLQLATPLLLLGADVRKCRTRCGPLLSAFVLASIGTISASTVAALTPIRRMLTSALGIDGLKVAAALMAKNVGGGINYVAVCRSLGVRPDAVAAGLCVDNIFGLFYFPATSLLAAGRPDVMEFSSGGQGGLADVAGEKEEKSNSIDDGDDSGGNTVTVEKVSAVLTLATTATWLGQRLGGPCHSLPASTLLTVLFATLAPQRYVAGLRRTGEVLGTSLLYLFFATAGAPGLAVAESVRAAFVPVGAFLTVLYVVHGAFLVGARWAIRLWVRRRRQHRRGSKDGGEDRKGMGVREEVEGDEGATAPQRLLVASSAAIGGPATAAALAQANGWSSLVAPSLLVGNLGYAVATLAGILFHSLCLRL